MFLQDVMSKVRYWDNKMAKWMIRHFYILFFEAVLVVIFVGLFMITLKTIDISAEVHQDVAQRLLLFSSFNLILITVLLLFNSFWTLYIFSELMRTRSTLKEMNFHLSKRKPEN